METDAEHQQNNAKLCELRSQFGIRDKTRGKRSGQNTR
ncbi:Uncharacterised protein [Yokenella regensburgei]|nr:Uncharacterised protein [Yokenella regensburgei]